MNMRRFTLLMSCLATVSILLLVHHSASAFIDTFRPETLAGACERAQSITVLRVTRFDKDKHIILYDVVKNLKGEFPRDRLRQVARDANEPHEMKHLMEWVDKGKTAVAFRYENRVAVCTGDQWSVCDQAPPEDKSEPYTLNGTRTEPWYNGVYFGGADKLVDAVADLLAGKEVIVPVMVGQRDKELRQRTGKIIRVRTSLKLKDHGLKRKAVEGEEGKTGASKPTIDRPLPTPGMGWTTFNFFGARHGDRLLSQMGDAFAASGLRDAGYTILRIDGGWWGNDGNRRWYYWTEAGKYDGGAEYRPGDPHVDPKNYPGGIRRLADYLHKKGLKLGFYLAPELSTGISDNYPGNKDHKEQPPLKGLDLIDRHARWVADNGIDHLFYDGYDWNEAKGKEPYLRMFSGLRKEAKRVGWPIVFSINSGWKARPREWADEWRTSPDINGEWKTILENLATVADPKPAGKGRWNNPDCLMVGYLGDEEAKSQMSLWCVAGAPLYLSHDHRVLNAHDRYVLLNTEAIAVDQDPAGTPGRRLRSEGAAQVWVRKLIDGSRAVVLVNTGGSPLTVPVSWSELEMPAGAVQVRDLWAHKNLGAHEKGYAAKNLPAHGCAFLRLTPGDGPLPEPKATWAPHPGKKPALTPLPSAGWAYRTTLPRKDDPLANLFDGSDKTGWWSYAAPGQYLQIDFAKPLALDRLVIDRVGAGPNPWPYKVYAPRSTFAVEVSEDGKVFKAVTEDSFGPAYTVATFKRVTARSLRIVLRHLERTSAYDEPTFGAKDIYLFDTAGVP